MKINIDYDGFEAKCSITTIYGNPDVFVNFSKADKYSQVYAMNAFKSIIENWEKGRKDETE